MTVEDRNKGIIATFFAAVLWSTGGLFIKLLPQDAFTILFYRSFYAALTFCIVFRKSAFKFNKLSLITSLFYTPLLICFVTSTKLTTAANAIFLQYTAPAFVLLLEPFFLKTKLKAINVVTVVLCFIGMIFFFMDSLTTPDNWLGVGLALISGFLLTGLLISQRMNKEEFQPGSILLGNLWVVLITIPWAIDSGMPTMNENLMLMFLGFGQLGLGFVLFTYGQRYIQAIESSLLSMLEPILNPIWVMVGYGEIPGIWAFVGGLTIVAALIFRLIWMSRIRLSRE